MQTSAPGLNNWYHVASAADGTRLAAVASDGIYTSADSGTTWTKTDAPNWVWNSIAMSADGTKLVASANYQITNNFFTSVDSGATWVSNTIPASSAIFVACPVNGSKLVAAVNSPGQIFTSTNMGTSWESVNPPGTPLYSFACSADGSTWVAGGSSSIFVTTNSGATWISNSVPALGPVGWSSCASSSDGSTLIAVATSLNLDLKGASLIFISTNFGITWIQADAPEKAWSGVATSADGCRLAGSAAVWLVIIPPYPGSIYTTQITPAPRMSITPTNGGLKLSWIVPSTDFVLQENLDLTTTNWTDVTNTPVLNLTNLQDEVTLSSPASSCFYRLVTQ